MRAGVPLSIAIHIALAASGIIVAPKLLAEPTPMVVLPIELLKIDDTTNVAAITERLAEQADAAATADNEATTSAAPAPEPEPEPAVILPTEKTPEVKKEEPAETAKTTPDRVPPKKAPDDEFSFESALKTIEKNKSKTPNTAQQARTANDPTKVRDVGARTSVGDPNHAPSVTIADYIRSQLVEKGCWADQDDMADAKRLRAVIRVRFERDGRLLGAPELREPTRPPAGDPPMQIFIQRAFRSLNQCEPFQLPAEYVQTTPPRWIDILFVP